MSWTINLVFLLGLSVNTQLAPPAPEEVMAIPPELVERMREEVLEKTTSQDERLERLVDFMFEADGLGFKYAIEPTRDVAGTFQAREGNCLSFTLLFLAMAKEAGLRTVPREVNAPLAWRRSHSTLFQSGHINVRVETVRQRAIVDFEPEFQVGQRFTSAFRGRDVSVDRTLAHFYNNRAAELLAQGRAAEARLWNEQALRLAPDFAPALNNRGVIEYRLGDSEAAERYYLKALGIQPENINTLFNMIILHRALGDYEKIEHYQSRLENIDPRDPYFQWQLGLEFEEIGDFSRARRMYRRAIQLSPNDHMLHASLARASEAMGHTGRAIAALRTAVDLAQADDITRDEYLDQLRALKASNTGGSH